MKLFKIKVLILIYAVASNISSLYAQDSITLNLESAVQLAIQKNTNISIANYQSKSAEFAVKEAKGNFLPKISLSANYNRNIDRQVLFLPNASGIGNTATQLGSDNDYSSSLNLSLPVFSNYNYINKKVSETQLKFQNESAREIRQTVVNSTKKSYFTYLIAQEVVKVQKQQLENAEETLLDIQKRMKQGTLTEYDLTTAKVQVANAKNSLLEAQSNMLPLANNLKLLLGIKSNSTLRLTEPITMLEDELNIKKGVNLMLEQNSKLKQLELDIDLNEKQVKLAKSGFYPTLDAIGNYNYQAQADDFDVSNYNWVNTSLIGLQLQFTIFNGTVTKNKVQQAEISKSIAEEQKEYTTSEYRMQFEELLSQLDFSKQKVEVQKENMELTEEALTLSKKRYQFGVGTFLEVNDAELSYTQAQLNWLQAISDYKSAYYDYQLLVGKE